MTYLLTHIGKYFQFLLLSMNRPEKRKIFWKQAFFEIDKLGIGSISITIIISFFFGAVMALQTAYNMDTPLLPDYLVGLGTRDAILLEFSSTILCLILAGKVGSSIASEIGTMRVTEQIDALEIMGVNSAHFILLPKIVAAIFFFPVLTGISMVVGITGGWVAGVASGEVPSAEFIYGLQYMFVPYYAFYSMVKTVFFAFIIVTVSSYYGYYTSGGALEVGRASTKAVVSSSLLILIFNLLITNIML
jgi:phospholipid/cholesterol/gamma-HCH transport system permease protein